MADNKDEKSEKTKEDKKVEESQESKKDEQPKENTVDAKPNETQNSVNTDILNKLNSVRQELIDYIDLKFASAPIAKVEKVESKEEKKLPVW